MSYRQKQEGLGRIRNSMLTRKKFTSVVTKTAVLDRSLDTSH